VYTKFFVHSYFGFRFVFRKHNPIPKVVKKGKKPPKSGTDYAGRHQQFCGVFNNYNFNLVPMRLRSDNGTQFEAGLFQAALKCWIVVWGNSTPHYSQSNGHAEAAVKTVKELVLKLAPSGDLSSEEFLAGLLEFRNTPHATGLSPAQIVFGLQLRSMVRPAHRSSHSNQWKEVMAARERQAEADVNKKFR
jgi:hypothetical protein